MMFGTLYVGIIAGPSCQDFGPFVKYSNSHYLKQLHTSTTGMLLEEVYFNRERDRIIRDNLNARLLFNNGYQFPMIMFEFYIFVN